MVLFLFGIMLTRATLGVEPDLNNDGWAIGIPVALLLFGMLAWVLIDEYRGQVITDLSGDRIATSTQRLSDGYLGDFLVPLIALSFVLLAAAIGSIVLARKD
jgi:NADH-quinone oxidoreductase subunit J